MRNKTIFFLIPLALFVFLLSQSPTVSGANLTTGTRGYGALGYIYERASFFDGTNWWMFVNDGTNYKYSYTTDPLNWSNSWTLLSADPWTSRSAQDVAYDPVNNRVMLSYGYYSSNYRQIAQNGTISGNSISWTRTQILTDASYIWGVGGDFDPTNNRFYYAIHQYAVANPYFAFLRWIHSSGWSNEIPLDSNEKISSSIGGVSIECGGTTWMNFIMNGDKELRYSIGDSVSVSSLENNIKSGVAPFSTLAEGSIIHLVYLNTTDDIEYRRYNGTWSARESVYMGTSDHNASFPVISLDGSKIIVVWGDETDDCIYMKKRSSSGEVGTWDASPTLVVNASSDNLYYHPTRGSGGLSVPEYANNTYLPVYYITGSSPFQYKVVNITTASPPAPNTAPVLGAYTISNWDGEAIYADDEDAPNWWLVATDADGGGDISTYQFAFKLGSVWCNFTYTTSTGEWTKDTDNPVKMKEDGQSVTDTTQKNILGFMKIEDWASETYNVQVYGKVTDASNETDGWELLSGPSFNVLHAPEDQGTDSGGPPSGPPPDDEEEDLPGDPCWWTDPELLNQMSLGDLRILADSLGVVYTESYEKAQIIQAILDRAEDVDDCDIFTGCTLNDEELQDRLDYLYNLTIQELRLECESLGINYKLWRNEDPYIILIFTVGYQCKVPDTFYEDGGYFDPSDWDGDGVRNWDDPDMFDPDRMGLGARVEEIDITPTLPWIQKNGYMLIILALLLAFMYSQVKGKDKPGSRGESLIRPGKRGGYLPGESKR